MTLLTLLTDFGLSDIYVGVMKAVILERCPSAQLVDLCHAIPPQDIAAAGWQLSRAWPCCAIGSVHLAVVDPGVGSARRGLAARVAGHSFVLPDNGLLHAAIGDRPAEVVAIDCPERYRQPVSRTFHGRDIFAPVAAALAGGTPLADIGPVVDDWIRLPHSAAHRSGDEATGTVRGIDHFGNLVTDIPGDWPVADLRIAGRSIPAAGCYAEVAEGAAIALVGSDGTWEASLRNASAAEAWGIRTGERVAARLRS